MHNRLKAMLIKEMNQNSMEQHLKALEEEVDKVDRGNQTLKEINRPSMVTLNQNNRKTLTAMLSSPKMKANSMTLQSKIKTISSNQFLINHFLPILNSR